MPVESDQTIETEVEPTETNTPDSAPVNEDAIESTPNDSMEAVVGDDNAAVTDDAAESRPDPDAWRQPYEELGFQNLESPEQAQQRMVEAFRQRDEQLREAQERLRYMQSIHSRIDNLGGQSAHASAKDSQPAEPSDLLTELTTGWIEPDRELVSQYIVTGEDGRSTWAPDTPTELKAQVEAYKLKKASWIKVLDDPRKLDQAITQRVERMLSQRLDETLSQRDTMTEDARVEQQFFSENEWLFDRDPLTDGPAIDPATGTPRLTREGRLFSDALKRVKNSGVTRRKDQIDMAMALFNSQQSQTRQAPAQQRATAQPTIAEQRASMLGRTNARPAKPTSSAGINDGKGAHRTGESRESWGASLVKGLFEERV
jgi:hypothetical protein